MTGCGQVRACTAIGAPPTIGIDISRILADQRDEVRVRVCVETTCDSTWKRSGRQLDAVFVDDTSIDHTGPVQVELSIEAGSGQVIYGTDASVELVRMQPNGPECEPTKYATVLMATEPGLTRVGADQPA